MEALGSKQSVDFMHLNLHIYSKFVFYFPTYLFSESIFGSQFMFHFNSILLGIIFSSSKI